MKRLFFITLALLFFASTPVFAADKMVFDSTDKYLGACQLTDKSQWELKTEIPVTIFEVWYSWNANETSLPVKIFLDGEKFAEFEATRSSCDPYQRQWCNADYAINKTFPKGVYTTEIPNKRQCLKPGGTGAIRLYQADNTVPAPTPVPTPTPTPTKIPTPVATIIPAVTVEPAKCECNQTVTIVSAVAASTMVSLLISFALKFKS